MSLLAFKMDLEANGVIGQTSIPMNTDKKNPKRTVHIIILVKIWSQSIVIQNVSSYVLSTMCCIHNACMEFYFSLGLQLAYVCLVSESRCCGFVQFIHSLSNWDKRDRHCLCVRLVLYSYVVYMCICSNSLLTRVVYYELNISHSEKRSWEKWVDDVGKEYSQSSQIWIDVVTIYRPTFA